jgi:hypothetical protein
MKTKNLTVVATTVFCSILPTFGQMPVASQQVDAIQQRRQMEQSAPWPGATNTVPELYAGEGSDIGPQSVLQVKPRRQLIEAFADVQYFYTDNMFLANQGKQSADVLVSTVSAALAPTPYECYDGLLAARLGYQHQWFSYGLANAKQLEINVYDPGLGDYEPKTVGLDYFDFNALTVFGEVTWSRQNWTLALGGDFRQLMDSDVYSEFYREYVTHWSVRRDFITSQNTALSIAYEGDYRLTDSQYVPLSAGNNYNDRTDNSLVIVGSWRLCKNAILQPSYRFQATHFTCTDRNDFLHSFGLALYCPITDKVTLRTYVSYDNMKSDGFYVQSYQKLDAGGGVNLTVRF